VNITFHHYAIALIIVFIVLGRFLKANHFSPLLITSYIWLLVFIVGLVNVEYYYPLTPMVMNAWFVWFSVQCLIYLFVSGEHKNYSKFEYCRKIKQNYSPFLVLMIIWLCYRIWYVGTSGNVHFLLNLRLSSIGFEDYESIGLVSRFYPIIYAFFLFEHAYPSRENKSRRVLLWIWMLLFAFASMGKFALLTPIITWLVLLSFQKRLNFYYLFKITICTFLLMVIMNFVRSNDNEQSIIESVSYMLSVYLYSPLVALGYMPLENNEFGQNSLRIFYAFGHSIGLTSEPIEAIQNYISVPVETNVYTQMRPMYQDSGIYGVFLGSLFISCLFSLIYYFARKGFKFFQCVYASLSICIVGQFLEDLFLMTFSLHIQVFMCTCFVFFMSKRVCNES